MSRKKKPAHISQEDWDAVDSPPMTNAQLARMRPAREVMPDLVAAYEAGSLRYRGQRGKQKTPTKVQTSVRLSPEVLAFFKAKGPGWQTRMDKALMAFVEAAK